MTGKKATRRNPASQVHPFEGATGIAFPDDEDEFQVPAPRTRAEIVEAVGEFLDKYWWNSHQCLKERIEAGEEPWIDPQIWAGARESAARVEQKYGIENLAQDDFDRGMIAGKLSALRWVLGEDWDELYT
jgi:hypothetical protein